MTNFLGAVALLWLVGSPAARAANTYRIEAVRVEGTRFVDPENILAVSGLEMGSEIQLPGPEVAEATKRIWERDLIKAVNIEATYTGPQRTVLTIRVVELDRISTISFQGVSNPDAATLKEKLALKADQPISEQQLHQACKTLTQHYVKEGYADARTTHALTPDAERPGHVHVLFVVNKAVKRHIGVVRFVGNQHLAAKHLKAQMQHTRERPRFTLVKDICKQVLQLKPVRPGGCAWRPLHLKEMVQYLQKHSIFFESSFDAEKFEEDKKSVLSYCHSKGFRDARIEHTRLHPHGDEMDVEIHLHEGVQYRVGGVKWIGNTRYSVKELNDVLGVVPGQVYNPVRIEEKLLHSPDRKDVASLYLDRGYLFFGAEAVEAGVADNEVFLEIRLQEGKQARIKEIEIEGNDITHEYVIRRELKTIPTEVFSRSALQRSQQKLALLSLFNPNIELTPLPDLRDNSVTLRYKVQERPKFELKASASWSGSGYEFLGGLSFGLNNFDAKGLFQPTRWKNLKSIMGAGQSIALKFESNVNDYSVWSFKFSEPWLTQYRRMMLHWDIHRVVYDQTNDDKGYLNATGARVGIGTQLSWFDDYTSLSTELGYDHRHCIKHKLFEKGQRRYTGRTNDLYVAGVWSRVSVDDPIYPTEGSKLMLQGRITPVLQTWWTNKPYPAWSLKDKLYWAEYQQWIVDGEYFQRLIEKLILHLRLQLGAVGSLSSEHPAGPFRRFVMGGMMAPVSQGAAFGEEFITLRGYEERSIAPVDQGTGFTGGVLYNKWTAEIRYPIASEQFFTAYMLGFAEAGNVWKSFQDADLRDLNRSAGVGLRVYLPMLIGTTVGLDWGYGFDRPHTNKNQKMEFHFSMGMGFR